MIASVVMLMVLAAAISSAATTRGALTDQYYNQIAKEAAESGIAMAEACIKSGTLTWPNPLRPGSDCNGAEAQCNDANCYLLSTGKTRTTFSVDSPINPGDTSTARAIGTVELTRASNSAVWKSYTQAVGRIEQGESRKLIWKEGSLSVGSYHACAVASDSKAYCWGDNYNGQLGDGTTTDSSVPVPVDTTGVLSGKTIKSIAAGSSHTCVVASDNQAYCWGFGGGAWSSGSPLGNNSNANSSVPVAVYTSGVLSGKTIRAITSGTNYSCVIASDNLPYCWGSGFSGSLGNGSTNDQPVPVAVTTSGVLSGKTVRQIVAGDLTTCVVASDNLGYCWGNNGSNGTFGNGTTSPSQSSVPVAAANTGGLSGKTLNYITTDGYVACAIASDNLPYCWGGNYAGQVGNNSTTGSSNPVAIGSYGALSGKTVTTIDAGDNFYSHTCAVDSVGKAYCWGYNNHGQLGDGTVNDSLVSVAVAQGALPSGASIRQIGAGNEFTCASTTANKIYCWGNNSNGQLGNKTTTELYVPGGTNALTDPASRATSNIQVTSGGNTTCVLGSDSQVYCWGMASTWTLYEGRMPQGVIPEGSTIERLAGESSNKCVIASDHKAYCWGYAYFGELGNGTSGLFNTPVAVLQGAIPNGVVLKEISAGTFAVCALGSNNWVYCWGNNESGGLGDGTLTHRNTPVALLQGNVPAGVTFRTVDVGNYTACGIASDNKVYCWGWNQYGQLGVGTTGGNRTYPSPVAQGAIPAGVTIQQLTVGDYHSCVLASNGKVYCWGNSGGGALGDGTETNRNTPVAVLQGSIPAGVTLRYISAGGNHTCAIGSNNKAYCWGNSQGYGALGDGVVVNRSTPVAILQGNMPSDVTFETISAQGSNTCAMGSDGKAYCWGYGTYRQIGDGNNISRYTPTAANPLPNYPAVEYRKIYY